MKGKNMKLEMKRISENGRDGLLATGAQFTAGDWEISEYPTGFNLEIIAEARLVATVVGTSRSAKETQANARLIAAAPLLLAAVELVDRWARLTTADKSRPNFEQMADCARAALATAIGE